LNPLTQPRWLLHAEGAALLAGSVTAFAVLGSNWWLFALLLLAPDLSALGYLITGRVGAASYNSVHIEVWPAMLLTLGYFTQHPLLAALALIWFAHLGMDRLVGFGLKYPTKFQDTHLQRV
jgi:hypothetical protein